MKKAKKGERVAIFALPQLSIQLQMMITSTFLMFFFTDFLTAGTISVTAITVMLLVGRLWDAFDDPLTGYIIDNLYKGTKKGKFLPLLKYSGIAMSVLFALFYTSFGMNGAGYVIYLYIVHIIASILGTLVGIAYPSLAAMVTKDPQKRTVLSTWRSLGGLVGGMLATIGTYPLMKLFGGENQGLGFTRVMWLYAIISVICLVIATRFIKEPKEEIERMQKETAIKSERIGFFKSVATVLKNKLLIIISGILLLNILAMNVRASSQLYFLKYYIGNEYLVGILSAISATLMILGFLVVPKISKKLGKKKVLIISQIVSILASIILIVAKTNLIFLFISTGLIGISIGLGNVSTFSLQMDTITFNEWKSGKRQEGMIWSYLGIISKVAFSLSPVVIGILLVSSSYTSDNITQHALNNIGLGFLWIPLVLTVLSTVLAFLIPVDDHRMVEINKEIEERKTEA